MSNGVLGIFVFLLMAAACLALHGPSDAKPSTLIAAWTGNFGLMQSAQGKMTSPDLPTLSERWTGDLEGMIKRRQIRALVVYSRSGFFYDQGHPEGVSYEAVQEFQKFVNEKYRLRNLPITVTFLPVGYQQMEKALTDGMGDLIAIPVAITPERQRICTFSTPIMTDVKDIVVAGPKSGSIATLEDLSGKEIYVNPLTVYYQTLQQLSAKLQRDGKAPIRLKSADANLGDEDLLEMVNAGLIPATVTTNFKAEFWSKVFPSLHVCTNCFLSAGGQLAWVMRKNSPELQKVVDEFVVGHREGTSFGNTLLRRYLQNTQWVTDATSEAAMERFKANVDFFRKFAAQYDFDYLMLVALAYQESGLNQDRRNPSGALGIMQVMPEFAAASPIDVPDVEKVENNIHAGTKMLRTISDTYFKNDKLDPLNRTLLTFASYNAGPNRISNLRKKAAQEGLDPNQWFGNVELVVSKDVGLETVRYVSNIYKYYVAYKLEIEQMELRKKEQHLPVAN